MRKKLVKKAKRIIVKIGSSVLMGLMGGGLTSARSKVFTRIAGEISLARKRDKEVIIVSSGAIAMGMEKLSIKGRPGTIPARQAVSSVGQVRLMAFYEKAFEREGIKVGQVLLTHDDFSERKRFLNARNTIFTLLSMGIAPIINENDAVSAEEIKFGDNDELSALTTNLVEADLLIMLTDIDGVYDKDPKVYPTARKLSVIEDIDSLKLDFTFETSLYGTGGIRSKLSAAKTAAHFGASTIVAAGMEDKVLKRILDGEDIGTLILPEETRLTSKKHWIAYSTRPTGKIFVDAGALEALLERNKSLLPGGVSKISGLFEAGDVVRLVDASGMEFARGLVNYSSTELEKIKGVKTREIENILGYKIYDEVVHRDNLVVL